VGRIVTVGCKSKRDGKEVEETKSINERRKETIFPIVFDGSCIGSNIIG
jgi:hypothetical protein